MLEQFLPRFNRRFRVPPQYPEPAFRVLGPQLCLEQILCFKHRRRVARDNTVRFQLHTLQLLLGREHPSYAGAAVEVLEGLDGRLSVRYAGRIIAAQETLPSPVFLPNCHGRSGTVPVPPSGANGFGGRWTRLSNHWIQGQTTRRIKEPSPAAATLPGRPQPPLTRKPTFLQKER